MHILILHCGWTAESRNIPRHCHCHSNWNASEIVKCMLLDAHLANQHFHLTHQAPKLCTEIQTAIDVLLLIKWGSSAEFLAARV